VRKTRTIDIQSFVEASEIDEKYIEQPYYLAPDEKAAQAYGLLREALKKSKKVAIALGDLWRDTLGPGVDREIALERLQQLWQGQAQ
jgi:non-homologous end joining protein Ku